jgi:hypothetical protein
VNRRVLLGLLIWLALAFVVGATGLLAAIGPPFPQLVLGALTVAVLAACRWVPALRAWVLSVDLRALVLFHVTRFVGFYFLALYGRGELPWAFAVPGGWGDIAVAAGSLIVVAAAARSGRVGWWAYLVWNAAGLVDILLVVATAARLALTMPGSMRALTVLPLNLLLTFVVPIIIATHVVIFARCGRAGGRPSRRTERRRYFVSLSAMS